MASAAFSVEEALKALVDHGFYLIKDDKIGSGIAEMDNNGSQFLHSTIDGVEFYRAYVLQDEVSCGEAYYETVPNLHSASNPSFIVLSTGVLWEITED